MSDDLFIEGDEPVEEPKKKPATKPKPKAASAKGSASKSAPAKKAPAKKKAAPAKEPGFEFTPMVVMLIAVITLLIGFLGGLLAANTLLTPTVNAAPPPGQQMPPQEGGMGDGGGMGGMGGMGGGMGMGMGGEGMELPPMTEAELEQLLDEMREQGMPEEMINQVLEDAGAVGTDDDTDADSDYY